MLAAGLNTPEEAGWDSYVSSISRDDDAKSFTGSFAGEFTVAIDQASYDSANDRWAYEYKLYMNTRGVTDEGTVTADAGSSLDIIGFDDADGNSLTEENYNLESGMEIIPEPASCGLVLGLIGLAWVFPRNNRSRIRESDKFEG